MAGDQGRLCVRIVHFLRNNKGRAIRAIQRIYRKIACGNERTVLKAGVLICEFAGSITNCLDQVEVWDESEQMPCEADVYLQIEEVVMAFFDSYPSSTGLVTEGDRSYVHQ